MIYRLEIENFYSIRDAQVLDLTIAPNVPDPDNRFAPIFQGSKDRAPKVVSIWGLTHRGRRPSSSRSIFSFGLFETAPAKGPAFGSSGSMTVNPQIVQFA